MRLAWKNKTKKKKQKKKKQTIFGILWKFKRDKWILVCFLSLKGFCCKRKEFAPKGITVLCPQELIPSFIVDQNILTELLPQKAYQFPLKHLSGGSVGQCYIIFASLAYFRIYVFSQNGATCMAHSIPLWKQAYSNILKILPLENENFQIKSSDIFHISAQNIDCGYSLELILF